MVKVNAVSQKAKMNRQTNIYIRRNNMANNYCQSSSFLDIPSDKISKAREILETAEIKAAKQLCVKYGEDESEYESYTSRADVEIKDDGAWIGSDESFDPEYAEAIARELVEQLELDGVFECSWACTCSKPRIDEFSGGAFAIVRGHPTIWCDATSHVQTLADAILKKTNGESDAVCNIIKP